MQTYPGRLRDASPDLREFVTTAAHEADNDTPLEVEGTDTTVPELAEQLELLELESSDDTPAVPPALPRERLEDIDKYASGVREHLRSNQVPQDTVTVQSVIVGTPVPHGRIRAIVSLEAASKPDSAKACQLLAGRYEDLFFKQVKDDPVVDFPHAALICPGDQMLRLDAGSGVRFCKPFLAIAFRSLLMTSTNGVSSSHDATRLYSPFFLVSFHCNA